MTERGQFATKADGWVAPSPEAVRPLDAREGLFGWTSRW